MEQNRPGRYHRRRRDHTHRAGSCRSPPAGAEDAAWPNASSATSSTCRCRHLRRSVQAGARPQRHRGRAPRRGAGRSGDLPPRVSHPVAGGPGELPAPGEHEQLEPGDEARVVSLPERDSELLEYLVGAGDLARRRGARGRDRSVQRPHVSSHRRRAKAHLAGGAGRGAGAAARSRRQRGPARPTSERGAGLGASTVSCGA